ncbi:XdhC family protein [Algibacillus agarilyticus]|uniref:XdhC family protein n=1 Tax=Algibacillus agarilyticus TaxID=2234133 RepID=UPI000DD0577F|nr:XdhC/CoxI family protein [Algibacillus agarilyticus]
MSNRFQHILQQWFPLKDDGEWVLATIIETKGSAYRKAGAMMLLNSFGQSFGLLSGGCLEADLMRQSRKCLHDNKGYQVCYDMQDDTDISWQLGIGCGGMVRVLLQPINQANGYLGLIELLSTLQEGQPAYYQLNTCVEQPLDVYANQLVSQTDFALVSTKGKSVLTPAAFFTCVKPVPRLCIFGGGTDALPLVNLAHNLGWHTTLVDSRSHYARQAYFPLADHIIKQPYAELNQAPDVINADAIVVMNHNVGLDAQALKACELSLAKYIGLLGPKHRTEKVFDDIELNLDRLVPRLHNPVGLNLGGELPESIALAIIAQAHAQIEAGDCASLNAFE